ncbi:uncharacterized protein N7459_009891 [Penicillium hispanicum]|uniref:uncharacterized protein n=1 Tax=Penicillium hispanicum TaxID=1080232 RepID=UPI002540935B|nr:uncharacterized protein N7459_009891 [Penicillium hispanicum]KAJ5570461.1 hypothetical protein N7459_009891 [Penicillium hispanicum]
MEPRVDRRGTANSLGARHPQPCKKFYTYPRETFTTVDPLASRTSRPIEEHATRTGDWYQNTALVVYGKDPNTPIRTELQETGKYIARDKGTTAPKSSYAPKLELELASTPHRSHSSPSSPVQSSLSIRKASARRRRSCATVHRDVFERRSRAASWLHLPLSLNHVCGAPRLRQSLSFPVPILSVVASLPMATKEGVAGAGATLGSCLHNGLDGVEDSTLRPSPSALDRRGV